MFRPIVTGKDTFQTEAIFDAMLKVGSVSGPTGALLTAASGIDIALWDIKGKALVVPIYELLGGIKPGREKVRVYASSLVRDLSPVDDAKRAADFQEQRFTGYKMHSAVPGAINHPADQTVKSVLEMRSATGDNFDILVLKSHPQIIAHMQMVEVDRSDFPLAHDASSSLLQRSPQCSTRLPWLSRSHSRENSSGDAVLNSNIS